MPFELNNYADLATNERKTNAKLVNFLEWQPLHQVIPTQGFLVITNEFSQIIQFFQWGLVPVWAKTPQLGKNMYRTKWENLQEKTALQAIYQYKRCVVPVTSYSMKNDDKLIVTVASNEGVSLLAGLWSTWGEGLQTFSILTYYDASRKLDVPFSLSATIKEQWLSKYNIPLSFLQQLKS